MMPQRKLPLKQPRILFQQFQQKNDPMSNGTMGEYAEHSRRAYNAGVTLYTAMRDLAIALTTPTIKDDNA